MSAPADGDGTRVDTCWSRCGREGFDDLGLRRAASARVTDYLLGGKTHYPPDRALADDLERAAPGLARHTALADRAFGHATAQFALARGVRQFLDLGCGLPTPWTGRTDLESTHQTVVRAGIPATVVCVDHDPVVLAHLRALAVGTASTTVAHIHADAREMKRLLAEPGLVDTLDIAEPVAVSLHGVLPSLTRRETVRESMSVLRVWLPPGSLISLTHLTADRRPAEVTTLADLHDAHGLPVHPRTHDEITDLLAPWRLLGPGIVPTDQWHHHDPRPWPPPPETAYAAVAVKETP